MKKLLFILFFAFKGVTVECMAQLLKVDFDDSRSIESYVSSDPNVNQFTYVGKSNSTGEVILKSGELIFSRDKNTTAAMGFSRIKSFLESPKLLMCEFDLTVSNNESQTTAALFYIGSGFANSNAVPLNADIHSRFSINFSSVSGQFSIKDSKSGGATGELLLGKKRLKFIINNLDFTYGYEINGKNYQLEQDKWDLFVDDEPYLRGINATTKTVDLNNIKFLFNGGIGSISIGNILVHTPTILPIQLEYFNVSHRNNGVNLSWKTSYESKVKAFEIHKSSNGRTFEKITSVKSEGKSAYYSYQDEYPANGTSYYKLLQVDESGNTEELSVKSLNVNGDKDFTVYATSDGLIVNYEGQRDGIATLILSNIKGQKVLEQQVIFNEGGNKLYLEAILKKGIYLVNADFDGDKYVKKLILD